MIEVGDYTVRYAGKEAVSHVSFVLDAGQTLALIGESGSGKTTLLQGIAGFPSSEAEAEGRILVNGKAPAQNQPGREISLIFQNPQASLDPVRKVRSQMVETIRTLTPCSPQKAKERALGLLERFSLAEPQKVMQCYPFELSGGMCQRVCIAMAMVSPDLKVLLADEPASALDQIVREETLKEIRRAVEERHLTMVVSTHDISLAQKLSDFTAVLYHGQLVEYGQTAEVLHEPGHPYTRSLIQAVPSLRSTFETYTRYESSERFPVRRKLSETHYTMETE